VLLDTLRREVFKTAPWACATMETIQLHVLKLGARVQELTDRMHKAPYGRTLEHQPLHQGPACCAVDAYVPRLITSPPS
jgi:hypothetical protein